MRKNIVVGIFLSVFICAGLPAAGSAEAGSETLALVERLIKAEGLDAGRATYLRHLTPPLFAFLENALPSGTLAPLFQAESLSALRLLLEKQSGRDLLEFGARMFEFFETGSKKNTGADNSTWKSALTDHFVFFYRPGSPAEKDVDFVLASSEEAMAAIVSSLDIGAESAANLKVLHVAPPPEALEREKIPAAGRIIVYLHSDRASAGDRFKKTTGSMSFGATILSEGLDKGAGRLTARIDVLYLNAISAAILHHEIAHAALFLGSFDSTALTAKPIRGESDLKKAFFAGYKPIRPFLHEGVGDYILYYQVIYPSWPLLPGPRELVRFQLASKDQIPLSKLLQEGAALRAQHRKAYTLEAASVVDYLIRAHGPVKLKAWFQTAESDSLKSFEKMYGYSVKELETRWKADLASEQGK